MSDNLLQEALRVERNTKAMNSIYERLQNLETKTETLTAEFIRQDTEIDSMKKRLSTLEKLLDKKGKPII